MLNNETINARRTRTKCFIKIQREHTVATTAASRKYKSHQSISRKWNQNHESSKPEPGAINRRNQNVTLVKQTKHNQNSTIWLGFKQTQRKTQQQLSFQQWQNYQGSKMEETEIHWNNGKTEWLSRSSLLWYHEEIHEIKNEAMQDEEIKLIGWSIIIIEEKRSRIKNNE